jgi:iron complex outermembrane receptor protein
MGGMALRSSHSVRRTLAASVSIVVLGAAGGVHAAPAAASINIRAQSLDSALQELARETGVNILYSPAGVAGLNASSFAGLSTVREAAEKLVGRANLEVVEERPGSLVVRPRSPLVKISVQSAAPERAAVVTPSSAAPSQKEVATTAPATGIEEVVVTATRQSLNVNRVALSIAAVTQANLDQQGVKSAADLTRLVPALTLVNQTAGVGTFAIRGIVATTGAATTGVYLDDTSVTKRNNAGVSQNNGAPIPTLFDLQRVEVLKGPQGTLYGGSSQGGTIRFITPTPSLTTISGLGRAELSSTENGGLGHEVGVAYGGPIIQDKLGFRVSGIERTTAGWIDVVSPYTGQLVKKDANGREEQALRGALLWQITDRA